jgi:hypothetical protein
MRFVLFSFALMALASPAMAQSPSQSSTHDIDWTVHPERTPGHKLSDLFSSNVDVSPAEAQLLMHAKAPAFSIRLAPYKPIWDALTPPNSIEEEQDVIVQYQPPAKSYAARLMIRGLQQAYDSKRPKAPFFGPRNPLLSKPHEVSGKLEFRFPLCSGKC